MAIQGTILLLAFASAGESFAETGNGNNNTIAAANSISIGTTYKGQIAKNDAKDFYKFTISSSGKITLTSTASMSSVYYRIYDSAGKQLWSSGYSANSTGSISVNEIIDLTYGTYYLGVEQSNGNTGNYSFKLSPHTHAYTTTVTKATVSSNGKIVSKCSCGDILTTTIYRPYTYTLSQTSFTYTGGAHNPSVVVKDSAGNVISADNYTVSYSNNINPGTATAKVTFSGNYSGSKSLTYTIKKAAVSTGSTTTSISVKGTNISSLKALKKGFKVKWKKQSSVSGYQIQYARNKKFTKSVKNVYVGAGKKTYSVRKLSAKKRYYVRIRTYKVSSGRVYYSSWSSKKSVKTKK